jgi:hypothetical protein
MNQTEIARTRLEGAMNAVAETEVAKARLSNSLVAICDCHGFRAAMEALDEAKADLFRRRPDEAEHAGWGS